MNKLSLSVLSLVLGLAIGILTQKSLSEAGDEQSGGEKGRVARGGSEVTPSKTSRVPSAEKNQPRKKVDSYSPRLEELRRLTSASHNSLPRYEFFKAIEELDLGEVSSLLAELQDAAINDAQEYKLSRALRAHWARLDPDGAWSDVLRLTNKNLKNNAIHVVMTEVSEADPSKAERWLSQIENRQERETALGAYMQSVAASNPEAGLRVFLELNKHSDSYRIGTLFSTWAASDPEAAISNLSKLTNLQARNRAQMSIASNLATSDPTRAMALAEGIQDYNERNSALTNVFRAITSQNPQTALNFLEELPPGDRRSNMISTVSSSWLQTDPDAALAWMGTLSPQEKQQALRQGISYMAQSDPAKAVELLASLPAGRGTSYSYSNLASEWAQQDPDAAAAWAINLPAGRGRENALNNIYGRLAKSDPEKAASIFEEGGYNQSNSRYAGTIVANWGTKDPEAAMAWMDGLDLSGNARKKLVSETVSRWAEMDVHEAKDFAMSLQDDEERTAAVGDLMETWGSQNPDEAKAWALSNLEGKARNEALGSIMERLAGQNGASAVELYDEVTASLSEEAIKESFGELTQKIARSWSYQDPESAGDWILQQAESENREKAVASIVDNWADYDLEGAANFVLGLNDGVERDGAVEKLVREVRQTDPEAAFLWADSIGDEKKRERSVRSAAKEWQGVDQDAARAAVEAAKISEEAKTKLLKEMD